MHIRIRWTDLLWFRLPRVVIAGRTTHPIPGRRILLSAITHGRFNERRQWFAMLIWMQLLLFIVIVPFAFAWWLLGSAVNVMSLDGLLIFTLMFLVVFAIGLVLMLAVQVPIATSLLKPEFEASVRKVAATTCLFCNYDLRGHEQAAVCPECGNQRYA